jgi:glycolate oxidase FAD binding subunit
LNEQPDPQELSIDGVVPRSVIAPATVEEVATLLRDASERRLAVCPVGGATQLTFGYPPTSCDVALLTGGVSGIVEYQHEDLTITVRCGTRLREVQEALAEHGQFLPLTSPSVASTVGGVLACDTPGPYRSRFGGPRDMLLGAQWVRADGEAVRAGGRVVKNVSGYDLHRVQVGALGTLGVLTEATFKVSPLPGATAAYHLPASSYADAWALADALVRSSFRYLVLDLLIDELGAVKLVVVVEGGEAVQERARRWLEAFTSGPIDPPPEHEPFRLRSGASGEAVARVSVPPASMATVAGGVPTGARLASQPAVGLMLVALPAATADAIVRLREVARAAGGHLNVLHAGAELKAQVPPWDDPVQSLELMRRMREAYDPLRILNPGRFLTDR